MSKQTPQEAMAELSKTLHAIFDPPLTRFLHWLDRQLRRSPRLYRFLSR